MHKLKIYLEQNLELSRRTVNFHIQNIRRFIKSGNPLTEDGIQIYLQSRSMVSEYAKANDKKSLRVYLKWLGLKELAERFKVKQISPKPINVPSDEELQIYYHALLDTRAKAIFLVYASSGLRRTEVRKLGLCDIDLKTGIVIANHRTKTKNSWVTFINQEALEALKEYLKERGNREGRLFKMSEKAFREIWHQAKEITGIDIKPQRLREWFCDKMGRLGVQERYIDGLSGRIAKSVLARHYTDYAPVRLKQIYDQANLRVLE